MLVGNAWSPSQIALPASLLIHTSTVISFTGEKLKHFRDVQTLYVLMTAVTFNASGKNEKKTGAK